MRERSRIGAGTVIGRGSVVDNDVAVGARVRVQTSVYLTAGTLVEDDVFIGPGVTTTNDDTMSRHGPEDAAQGARLRRACRVGGGAVLTPAWRSARRRSSPPARWLHTTCRPARW